ncbi:hypothetical protein BKA81DRAFT_34184 [Phyllosticta paracitricarpa]
MGRLAIGRLRACSSRRRRSGTGSGSEGEREACRGVVEPWTSGLESLNLHAGAAATIITLHPLTLVATQALFDVRPKLHTARLGPWRLLNRPPAWLASLLRVALWCLPGRCAPPLDLSPIFPGSPWTPWRCGAKPKPRFARSPSIALVAPPPRSAPFLNRRHIQVPRAAQRSILLRLDSYHSVYTTLASASTIHTTLFDTSQPCLKTSASRPPRAIPPPSTPTTATRTGPCRPPRRPRPALASTS